MFNFYTISVPSVFLTFSGGIEIEHWTKIGQFVWLFDSFLKYSSHSPQYLATPRICFFI